MLHTQKGGVHPNFLYARLKRWEWPGDEARHWVEGSGVTGPKSYTNTYSTPTLAPKAYPTLPGQLPREIFPNLMLITQNYIGLHKVKKS